VSKKNVKRRISSYSVVYDRACSTWIDRYEIEHDSIKNFLRYHANGNLSFNAYLNSIGTADVFTINEKICLQILYRNHFVEYYNAIQ
jgi:hypothetical protein